MSAIWARRQKLANSTSSKRRRTADIEQDRNASSESHNILSGEIVSKDTNYNTTNYVTTNDKKCDTNDDTNDDTNNDTNNDIIGKAIASIENDVPQPESQGDKTSTSNSVLPKQDDAVYHSRVLNKDLNQNFKKSNANAAPNIRASTAVDFQRDICKQYKLKGTCSYGDSCKFLHEREDHAAGRKIDKGWEVVGKECGTVKGTDCKGENTSACSICGTDPPEVAVKPSCGHLCCEKCFIKESKKVTASCLVCHKRLGHVAESIS